MLLKINQIKVPVGTALSKEDIAKKLHTSLHDVISYTIEKESLDARGENLVNSYTVLADIKNAEKHLRKKDVQIGKEEKYISPEPIQTDERPVIVGFGPSGMFAGLLLSECGCRPIIIERGKKVEERQKDIDEFFQKGVLLEESNIQYGEGGAGTFSDGKLTTRMKNIRVKKVLEELIEAGADQEIYYQNRAHIGTDVLRVLVKNIREKIISLGGEIHFSTRLESIETNNGKVHSILTNTGKIQTNHVLLCCGHSASDTYETLYAQGIHMIQKDFACGVRVEHPQALINQNQYGKFADHPALGAASYSLTHHSSNGRGVYSFCMCPGGFVVPAASGPKQVVVNGMSPSNRGSRWSNSGMVVEIRPEDYSELIGQEELYLRNGEKVDADSPLALMAFQERLEEVCWLNGGMKQTAPAQRMDDFMRKKNSFDLPVSSYTPGLLASPLHFWMPEFVTSRLREGFRYFGKVSRGFLTNEATMIGVETRTSAPVRIVRDRDTYQHVTVKGLFPCGEGAGYAGGIVSAAIDGERCAEGVYNLESNK